MAYEVLARKYRPRRFDAVIGQEAISRTLKNAIAQDRVGHAYLFAGPRGVGKTTVARIFAAALNCEKAPAPEPCGKCESCRFVFSGDDIDVLEIDAASRRKVEEIGDILEHVAYSANRSRYKIYVVDEVHMLSAHAFNSLLKTLEEPPKHVKFILATTEPEKVPETVRSRCQRFDFRRIPTTAIAEKLGEICKKERIKAKKEVLLAVARASDGSIRDAESLLDQLVSFCEGEIRLEDVETVAGRVSSDVLFALAEAFAQKDPAKALEYTKDSVLAATAPGEFLAQLAEHLRDLLVVRVCKNPGLIVEHDEEYVERLKAQASPFSPDALTYMIEILAEARRQLRTNMPGRVVLEMVVIKLARVEDLQPIEQVIERLERLMGSPAPAQRGGAEAAASRPAVERKGAGRPPAAESSGRTEAEAEESSEGGGDLWGSILAELGQKRPGVRAALALGKAELVGEGRIRVTLPKDAAVTASNHGAAELVAQVASRLLKRPIKVDLVEERAAAKPAASELDERAGRGAGILGGRVIGEER